MKFIRELLEAAKKSIQIDHEYRIRSPFAVQSGHFGSSVISPPTIVKVTHIQYFKQGDPLDDPEITIETVPKNTMSPYYTTLNRFAKKVEHLGKPQNFMTKMYDGEDDEIENKLRDIDRKK